MGINSAEQNHGWKRRVRELNLACTCWECLRRVGITPDRGAAAVHRTDVTGRLHRCDGGAKESAR